MTHNFHWNVTGPQFNSLHQMFMGQYTEQWNALDIIAERIRALGFPAPGTYKEFVKLASIKEVEGVPKANDMVRHLVAAQEATARTARKLFPVVTQANDQPTADADPAHRSARKDRVDAAQPAGRMSATWHPGHRDHCHRPRSGGGRLAEGRTCTQHRSPA
jgi:DNA-binding ferritin-like protein